MTAFLDILALMIGGVTFAIALTLVGMLWSGKITLPGTDARRVQRANNDAKITQFQLEQAEAQRLIAQEHLNRQIMEVKGSDTLEQLQQQQFQRELSRGTDDAA